MKQNPKQAVKFLEFMYPDGPWLLSALPTERSSGLPPEARTFFPGDDVTGWLERFSGGTYNFYFAINRTNGTLTKKATRLDIEQMNFLHVDLDPRAGEDVEGEQDRILKLLTDKLPEGVPEPSAVIYSGGGYWGFWRLSDGFEIRRSVERYEEAKLFNLQLELLFSADSCHNVDRIARLPGTVNYPTAKKVAKGRVAALAKVVFMNENTYALESFTKAPQLQSGTSNGFTQGKTVTISENVERVNSLDELPTSLKENTKVIIAQGHDPDDPNRWADEGRSGALWYICCELVRCGVDDDTIYAIITDPDWAISESVIDGSNGRGDGYARRQIERAREFAVDPKLAEFNNKYAVVQNIGGGRCRIVYEEDDASMVLQSPGDFKSYYSNEFVTVPTGNATKEVPIGKWWFEHRMRRSYRSIVFLPGQEVPDDVYNLWRGFAYEAIPGGSCELYLEHLLTCICSGDQAVFDYVLSWMAMAVQRPWEQGHTALVLRGSQGAGKGTFAKTFYKLFGRHGKQIASAKHLVGNFNAHLRDCVVLFADEAMAASNREHEAVLKTLVTEDSLMVEAKGIDVTEARNYLHVIMASNSDWVVPAGVDDRRFVVLDVSGEHKQDASYFRAINQELNNGGYQALLYQLTTRDLSTFDPRKKPTTAALQDQKTLSFDTLAKWWYSVLQEGMLGEVFLSDGLILPTSYIAWNYNVSVTTRDRVSLYQLNKFLAKAAPMSYTRRQATKSDSIRGESVNPHTGMPIDTSRPNIAIFSNIAEMRKDFDATHGGPYSWTKAPTAPEKMEEPF